MAPSDIFTFGYSGRSLVKFKAIVLERDALVLDIRILAWSKRYPDWTLWRLVEAFGHLEHPEEPGRYLHFTSWGNRNRFCGEKMELANWDYGLRRFEQLPEQPVILLCACRALAGCHRGLVARRLREEGYRVTELPWPARKSKEPLNLFTV